MSWTGFGGGRGSINSGSQNMASGNPSAANYGGGGSSSGNSGGASGYNDAGAGSYTRTEGGWVNSYNSAGYLTGSRRATAADSYTAGGSGGGNGSGSTGGASGGGASKNDFAAAAEGYQSAVKRVAAAYGISEGAATRLSVMMTAKPAQLATLRNWGNHEAMEGVAAYDRIMAAQNKPPQPAQPQGDGGAAQRAAEQQAEQQRQAQAAEQQRQQQAAEQQRQQQEAQRQAEQQRQQQEAQAAAERQRQAEQAAAAERQRQQQEQAAAAERQRQAEQAAAEKARQEAEAAEKARVEKAYQDNLAKVSGLAKSIGENSIYGTGNLETNRQYNDALQGLRPEDRDRLAEQMSDAREAARAARQQEQEKARDSEINKATANEQNTSRVAGALQDAYNAVSSFLGNPLGQYGGANTVGGTVMNGLKWGMRGMEAAGPLGGVAGLIGGMIANNVDSGQLAESLRGYNPTGLGGTVAGSPLDQQAIGFSTPMWNRNANGGDRSGNKTVSASDTAATGAPKPVDKQATAAINNLIPTAGRNAVEAGLIASNSYLRALHGRYAKYMLSTGAEGSGTSLLQRTAGGQGALGGTSGRLLYTTGGNG